MKDGKDSRFDEIKKNPLMFSGAWQVPLGPSIFLSNLSPLDRLGQATWITCAGLPVYLINSIPRAAQPRLGLVDLIGLSVWLGGFALEVTADRQKSAWRQRKNEKKHDEPFIKEGVWSWSRHPK
jgi:steroid 5-alpha reductase family enzyme